MPIRKSFKEFTELTEALVTFGGKAYPKYGNVVILAGGGGSGKGFVTTNLLGIEAKVIDVDETKRLALKSENIAAKIEHITGKSPDQFDFKNPEDVAAIHVILSDVLGTIAKKEATLNQALTATSPDRLPNIVFDVTLKDITKFKNIIQFCEYAGYDKRNIHVVWVVNSLETSIAQNNNRKRVVPEKILIDAHIGVAKTFKDLLDLSDNIGHYMNGDIWIVFNNQAAGDVSFKKSEAGGKYVDQATYIKVKKAGSTKIDKIPQNLLDKIANYTQNNFK